MSFLISFKESIGLLCFAIDIGTGNLVEFVLLVVCIIPVYPEAGKIAPVCKPYFQRANTFSEPRSVLMKASNKMLFLIYLPSTAFVSVVILHQKHKQLNI